jgi:MraZ protein
MARRAMGQARGMDEFVSTFTNRLDAKGRVSIPAPFRSVLAVDGFDGIYCCPTLDRQAIDAGGNRFRDIIRASLANFEPFSEDHEYLSTTLIGESEILKYDREGRVVLTDTIREHAGIGDRVTFVGQGYKFQIWEPERFAAYREEAKNRLRDLRRSLGSGRRPAGADVEAGT